MSRFAPVHLPEDRQLDGRLSQTMLRVYNGCPRSGFLYSKFKGEMQTAEMVRGQALHAVIERTIRLMVKQGESVVPPEVAKAILNEVLAELPVPVEEHDYLREMVFRWAAEWKIEPRRVVANETLFVLELGGYQVRARLDFVEQTDLDCWRVTDYKSSRWAPPYEEIARKRPADGSLAAKIFQLVFYGVMLMFGEPLVEGVRSVTMRAPVAASANRIDLEYVYPGIETSDGRMLRRSVSLTRLELAEYRESLAALVARVAESEKTGDWPAVVSDGACTECACPLECPIPAVLRPLVPAETLADAADKAEEISVRTAQTAVMRKGIKAFAKREGTAIRFGRDRVWEFQVRESERIDSKAGMFAAMEEAVERGVPFDRDAWAKTVRGTSFVERRLTVEELEAENA